MAKVIVALSMSLDGFIAGANDGTKQPLGVGGMRLFQWYFDGDTPIPQYQQAAKRGVPAPPFKLSRSSAEVFGELVENCGAAVTGRRTYDIAGAWNGNGPIPGVPVFVVTHNPPKQVPQGESQYTFVTDGVENAVEQAKAAAGKKNVSVMGSSVPQQCLRSGLLDEILIHLVPVLLGDGVRLFDHLGSQNVGLERQRVVQSPGVTHLWFKVVR
jgi:dihydrofolate reductase